MRSYVNFWNGNALSDGFQLMRNLDHFFEADAPSTPHFVPACDIEESATHYVLSFDMPGVSKEDLKIELKDNQLTVQGERKRSAKSGDAKRQYVTERSFGKFSRTISIEAEVNADHIEAVFKDGVLQVTIPKAEAAKPRQIQIQSLN